MKLRGALWGLVLVSTLFVVTRANLSSTTPDSSAPPGGSSPEPEHSTEPDHSKEPEHSTEPDHSKEPDHSTEPGVSPRPKEKRLKTVGDMKRALKGAVNLITVKAVDKEQICPRGKIFCLQSKRCVPMECRGVRKVLPARNLRDNLNNMVSNYIKSKTDTEEVCRPGMLFCMSERKCVPASCSINREPKPGQCPARRRAGSSTNGPLDGKKPGDGLVSGRPTGVRSFGTTPNRIGIKSVGTTPNRIGIKPGGTTPSRIGVQPVGTTPQRKQQDVILDDEECSPHRECEDDNEGCDGNDKCCENECGGATCSSPEIEIPDRNDPDAAARAYRVVGYASSSNPEPIKFVGGSGFFSKPGDAPKELTFNISSSSGGCTWKTATFVPGNSTAGKPAQPQRVWKKIEDGEIVTIDSAKPNIACIPDSPEFHGLSTLNVTADSGKISTLAVFIMPVVIPPIIKLNDGASAVIELKEDEEKSDVPIPVTVTAGIELKTAKLMVIEDYIGVYSTPTGEAVHKFYVNRVKQLDKTLSERSLDVYIRFKIKPTVRVGELKVKASTKTVIGEPKARDGWVPISVKNGGGGRPFLKFLPEKDYFGDIGIVVYGRYAGGVKKRNDESEMGVTFTVKILGVNDAPFMDPGKLRTLDNNARTLWQQLMVPYDLDNNDGISIGDITDEFFHDGEGTRSGMCVIRAQNTALGKYQYQKAGNTTWIDVVVEDPADVYRTFSGFRPKNIAKIYKFKNFAQLLIDVKKGTKQLTNTVIHQCLALDPSSKVRFQPSTQNSFWNYRSPTKWDFMAWDKIADKLNKEGDKINMSLPICEKCLADDSVLSYSYLSGDAMRLGCKGKPSEVPLVNDVCGICGGDNSTCVDCHGDRGGLAKLNPCNKCVGGNTGKKFDEGQDCKGGCSTGKWESSPQLDNACVKVGTDTTKLIKRVFCDGVWNSGAKIDSCGNCTGGGTGKARNGARDGCGICHGDNSTCTDCDNKVKGEKVTDKCGKCLLRTAVTFNTGCRSLSQISPANVVSGVAGNIFAYGAGLENYDKVISCKLTKGADVVTLDDILFDGKRSAIRIAMPAIKAAGKYRLSCQFNDPSTSTSTEIEMDTAALEVIGVPNLTSLIPSQVNVGSLPDTIVVKGSGFVNTGTVYCFTNCPVRVSKDCRSKTSVAVFKAKVVDSKTVHCAVPKAVRKQLNYGVKLNLSVALSNPIFASAAEIAAYQRLVFTLVAAAPKVTSAKFRGACTVLAVFDDTITDIKKCEDALDAASVGKLGKDPRCRVRGNRLLIKLGKGSTLSAGAGLTLEANKISQRNADNPNFASGTFNVAATAIQSVKFEGLKAPPVIGDCDSVKIRAKFQGAGCSTLQYKWTVTLAEGVNNGTVQEDLANLTTKLNAITNGNVKLGADDIVAGNAYTFTVHVETQLGEKSTNHSVTIERKAASQKLRLDLGPDITNWDIDKPLRLRARVSKSDCVNIELTALEFIWVAEGATDFSLDKFNKMRALIGKKKMRGGKEYTIKAIATDPSDETITASATIKVSTGSKDLEPTIRRAPVMITGTASDVVLDASKSRDPDRVQHAVKYYTYFCAKIVTNDNGEDEKQPCMIIDPKTGKSVQFEESSILPQGNQTNLLPVVVIPGNTLDSNSVYEFEVEMAVEGRKAVATITVYVKEGDPPKIIIQELEGQHNPKKLLMIKAFVSSSLAFTATWSPLSGEGYEDLDYGVLDGKTSVYEKKTGGKNYPITLIIKAEQLKPGAAYQFQVDVVHADSSSRAEIVVVVNAPPECTSLSVNPVNGTALTDQFVIEADGCDDDIEDFPLKYRFYVIDMVTLEIRQLTKGSQGDSDFETKLEPGMFKFGVRVCDQNDVCSVMVGRDNVTVGELQDLAAFVDNLLGDIAQEFATGAQSKTAAAAVKYIFGARNVSTDTLLAGIKMINDQINNALGDANPEADPEGSLDSLNAALDSVVISKGVEIDGVKQSSMDEGTSAMFLDKSTKTTEVMVLPPADGAARKKRAAAENGPTVNAIDIATAENLMAMQVAALEETAEDKIAKDDAVAFFNTLELAWRGVCAGIATGESAQIGKTSLLTFKAYTTAFAGLGNTSMYVSCDNCTEVKTPATFTIGSGMEEKYTEWNCTDSDKCYGSCLATAQLNYDILTASSDAVEPLLSTRLSDIVAIRLINPTTYAFKPIVNISSPISFKIKLTATPAVDTYKYMCRGWDSSAKDWTDNFCQPIDISNSTGDWIAECSCVNSGYFGVFQGDEIIDAALLVTTPAFAAETEAPVTNASETTTVGVAEQTTTVKTTTSADFLDNISEEDVESVLVSFKFDADANLLTQNYTVVKDAVIIWLINALNVTEDRITGLTLTSGSIVVEFALLPGTGGQTNLNQALTKLKTSVTGGAAITIGGTTYNCVANSFSASVKQKPVATTTEKPVEAAGMKIGVIIGIVVGCCLLVILVVVVVAVVIIKKNSGANKIQQSPRASEANLGMTEQYSFKKTAAATPEEEALYGPAPVPHQPAGATAKGASGACAAPIGSRPNSGKGGRLTPVE